MAEATRILIVEDAPADAELAVRALRSAGMDFVMQCVDEREAFAASLRNFAPDVILSDFTLPGAFDGLASLELARQLAPDVPFIFVSGTIGEERAIEAMRSGATDYVLKTNMKRLPAAVSRALEAASERRARRAAEHRLRDNEQRFSRFMEHLPGIAFMKDTAGNYVFANRNFTVLAGRTSNEIVGRSDREVWPAPLAEAFQQHDLRALQSEGVAGRIQHIPAPDGQTRAWLIHKFRIDGPGSEALVGGVGIDLSERLRAERRAARLSRMHRVLSGINSAIVRLRNRQELFEEACRIAVEAGGFRLAWIGLRAPGTTKLLPVAWLGAEEGYLEAVGAKLATVLEDGGAGGQVLKTGRRVTANDIASDPDVAFREEALARGYRSLAALPLRIGAQIEGAFLLYSKEVNFFSKNEVALLDELAGDISFALEYMEKAERLDYLALYDPLTGLANRALLKDRVERALSAAARSGSSLALVLVDIARFHLINDKLGRQTGDELLRRFAELLATEVGAGDRVARVSADCFALILELPAGESPLEGLLARLCDPAGLPFRRHGQELRLTLHAGLAIHPDDGADFEALIGRAELALRQAKAQGMRHLRYTPEIEARRTDRLSVESKLRRALEREEFVLHYQPKVRLRDQSICGLEALLRWNDPDLGLVSPARFIPLLEETGLIVEVGRWVMHQAVKDCLRWRALGLPPIRVATNIATRELQQKDLIDVAGKLAAAFASDQVGLELEITESGLMQDIEGNIARFHALRELGIRIAIDDFGTGYSSLSYIARLPADCLKIDGSFIVNMASNADDFAVVSSIISLATGLKMEVVAEGVETREQANMLALLKCDFVQGFLFSSAVPAEETESLLRNGL